MPDQTKDYTDGFGGGGGGIAGDDYDDKADHATVYSDGGRPMHLQQQQQRQPWHFVLLNYGRNAHRNHNLGQNSANSNSKVIASNGAGLDDLISFRTPRSQQRQQSLQHQQQQQQQQLMGKLHRDKQQQQKSAALSNTNAGDTNERVTDLDWITSTSEQLNGATDYDALYDDVNEKQRRSPSSSSAPASSSMMNFDRYRRNGPPPKQQTLN